MGIKQGTGLGIVLFGSLVIASCAGVDPGEEKSESENSTPSLRSAGCRSDRDCFRTGCSGQVCSDEHMLTTCERRAGYGCYRKPFARCGCIEGQCAWEDNAAMRACLSRGPSLEGVN